MKNKENFWESKPVTTFFALIALISGFLFLNSGITGSVILNNKSSFDLFSLIGILLIICSVILGLYTIKKR